MSKTIDGAGIRKQRLNQILQFVEQNPQLSGKELSAKIAFETGLTEGRVEIYLAELKEAGKLR